MNYTTDCGLLFLGLLEKKISNEMSIQSPQIGSLAIDTKGY